MFPEETTFSIFLVVMVCIEITHLLLPIALAASAEKLAGLSGITAATWTSIQS